MIQPNYPQIKGELISLNMVVANGIWLGDLQKYVS